METKNCPFCGEEIKIEAIKCKHCGEFLNKTEGKVTIESKELINEKKISPQNFNTAIVVAIIYVVLSIFTSIDSENKTFVQEFRGTLYYTIFSIWLWLLFKKYISNYKSDKIQTLIYWSISFDVVIGFLSVFLTAADKYNEQSEWTNDDTFILFLGFSAIVIMILYLIVTVKLGNGLIKMKDDFVGLLKELGISLIIVLPISLFLSISGAIYNSNSVTIIASVIGNIPYFIMILIFIRAKKQLTKAKTAEMSFKQD